MATSSLAIKTHFRKLKDPRCRGRRHHRLLDILVIAICAVVAGSNSWTQIEAFGKRRQAWLKRFLALDDGIPSHDTFQRVFEALDAKVLQTCMRQWLLAVSGALGLEQIAIDGKSLRGSADASSGLAPLHLVSAWATKQHLSLGQVLVEPGSNEITAIPKLLELLDLNGALVSLDAMGCQKDIARRIVEGGGDYILTVKGNQPELLEDIQQCLQRTLDDADSPVEIYETVERRHGRQERRCYTVLRHPEGIRQQQDWPGLKVIGMCASERTVAGTTSSEVRYFIGSKAAGARYYSRALRSHWWIENCLHWQMDISFGEDANRTRQRNAANSLALLRRTALTLLKRYPSTDSIICKRLQAAWDPDFLEEILLGAANSENL